MTGTFYISRVGTTERYMATGKQAGDTLIISASFPPYGKHDLHCNLHNPDESKCYYYDTGNHPEPVKAGVEIIAQDEEFIELIWTENATRWEIEGSWI